MKDASYREGIIYTSHAIQTFIHRRSKYYASIIIKKSCQFFKPKIRVANMQ